ncbi:MAG: AAA family ATPase [Candidatus Aenigmarchaeota archaeon]|nr:AAA family ATPase [Candidatus Aenigmarchaeota archaeon]
MDIKLKVSASPIGLKECDYCKAILSSTWKDHVGDLVSINNLVYRTTYDNQMIRGAIFLNTQQRMDLSLALGDIADIIPTKKENYENLSVITVNIKPISRNDEKFNGETFKEKIHELFDGSCLGGHQRFKVAFYGVIVLVEVMDMIFASGGQIKTQSINGKNCGLLSENTEIYFSSESKKYLDMATTSNITRPDLFSVDFTTENLGVGGLGAEFMTIFRRAFTSRIYPNELIEKLGISHVKGILLYGPPGTGKTLLARQIGKMLNAKPPKIIAGPEVLNKFVGESEQNIRNLFKDAEDDYKQYGDKSELHIIILDELDAICRARGSSSSNLGDGIVNQLLSKIDGVEALNNILLIGMTNRLDMIDDALLRPGRFELHLQISLPNETGRLEILKIHTKKMKSSGCLSDDVNLPVIAARTKNYSGAEIEGLVKTVVSYTLNEKIDYSSDGKRLLKNLPDNLLVMNQHFNAALEELQHQNVGSLDDLLANYVSNGIVSYSKEFDKINTNIKKYISDHISHPLVPILITGQRGSGKTALAVSTLINFDFPYIKIISPGQLAGLSEPERRQFIIKTFNNAYDSLSSGIILDDLELLIDYTRVGLRFSNVLLHLLITFIKKKPPIGRTLFIIGTSTGLIKDEILNEIGLKECFHETFQLPFDNPPIAELYH